MRKTFLSLMLATIVLPSGAFAMTTEQDMTREREAFPTLTLSAEGVTAQDEMEDLTLFDRSGTGRPPPVLADVTAVAMTPGADGWTVRFDLLGALPGNPDMPVNFDVLVVRDGMPHAEDGVFRAGSDLAFLLLFGTRTRWHTETWTYDAAGRRWEAQPSVPFGVEGNAVTLQIPYATLPRDTRGSARFLSLTSQSGATAVDIVPGNQLPAVREAAAVTTPTSSADASPSAVGFHWILGGGAALLGTIVFVIIKWTPVKNTTDDGRAV